MLLVKYKTVKQLREVRDPRYLPESLSQKDARHLQVQLSSEHKLFLDPDEMISKVHFSTFIVIILLSSGNNRAP